MGPTIMFMFVCICLRVADLSVWSSAASTVGSKLYWELLLLALELDHRDQVSTYQLISTGPKGVKLSYVYSFEVRGVSLVGFPAEIYRPQLVQVTIWHVSSVSSLFLKKRGNFCVLLSARGWESVRWMNQGVFCLDFGYKCHRWMSKWQASIHSFRRWQFFSQRLSSGPSPWVWSVPDNWPIVIPSSLSQYLVSPSSSAVSSSQTHLLDPIAWIRGLFPTVIIGKKNSVLNFHFLRVYRAKPPFMFAESTRDLVYLARQLPILRADQLWRLACWTSPFGLSDEEIKSVDAAANATANATTEVLVGVKGKMGILPKTPSSLVFGWNTYGLHCIYKCISRVAGNLSTNHPAESRDILQVGFIWPWSNLSRWFILRLTLPIFWRWLLKLMTPLPPLHPTILK